jgi:hypothetical protein
VKPETDEIQMREEDGVRTYSVVSVYPGVVCDICLQDVPETAELVRTDVYDDGDGRDSRRSDTLYICQGCAYRVGGMFNPHNAGKELFCGGVQDAY